MNTEVDDAQISLVYFPRDRLLPEVVFSCSFELAKANPRHFVQTAHQFSIHYRQGIFDALSSNLQAVIERGKEHEWTSSHGTLLEWLGLAPADTPTMESILETCKQMYHHG